MPEETLPERESFREMCERMGMKPYTFYHDDKGKQWMVVTSEDSVVCLIPDDVLIFPGQDSVAMEMARHIAELLCEDLYSRFEEVHR